MRSISSCTISLARKVKINKARAWIAKCRYLAPEYALSGKLAEKADIFSFGVMLLELITGCRPLGSHHTFMEVSLVEWVSIMTLLFYRPKFIYICKTINSKNICKYILEVKVSIFLVNSCGWKNS